MRSQARSYNGGFLTSWPKVEDELDVEEPMRDEAPYG
jgi:hypothetical protein